MNYQKLIKYDFYIKYSRIKYRNKSKNRYKLQHIINFFLKILNLSISFFLLKIKEDGCDILVLASHESNLFKTNHIWEELKNDGFSIKFVILKKKNYLSAIFKVKIDRKIPTTLLLSHAYSRLLIHKYRPKVLCSFVHMGVLPSLIRKEMPKRCKSVYMPHAVTDSTFLYSNQDYDYYFIFGQSSNINIFANKKRIGNTKLVKVGSPYVNFTPEKKPYKENHFIFFSTWILWKDGDMQSNVKIIHEWFKENIDCSLRIKLHPLEDRKYISNRFKNLPNVYILDKNISFRKALKDIKVVLSTNSVATVEAAMFGIPTITVNHNEKDVASSNLRISDKYLYLEDFFTKRAKTKQELYLRIKDMNDNYDYYVNRCKDFVKFHVDYIQNSHKVIEERISSIYHGREGFNFIELKESFSD